VIEPLGVGAVVPVELVDMPCIGLETIEPSPHLVVVSPHSVEAAPPLVQIPQGFLRREVLLAVVEDGSRVSLQHVAATPMAGGRRVS
jgi:hypothetical protein